MIIKQFKHNQKCLCICLLIDDVKKLCKSYRGFCFAVGQTLFYTLFLSMFSLNESWSPSSHS